MIRKNAITAITSIGVIGAVAGCFAFAHPSAVQASPQSVMATVRPIRRDRDDRERHPELRRALMALSRAKQDLQRGAHDFGGHRAKALQLTDQAIDEVHDAMQADGH